MSNEKKAIKAEFAELVNTILYSRIVNDHYQKLHYLRMFFVRHPEYLKNKDNQDFFDKWLTDSAVEQGVPGGGNAWTLERVKELYTDLMKLKV